MTHTGIECFLAVCRHKTGTAAAQALFITQPSLSARLKNLETELGGALFYRRKGSREMLLTPAGQEFYALAVQYEALLEKMGQVCHNQRQLLRISSFNSLGTYLLPAVYELFTKENPGVSLELQDMESEAAVQSLLGGHTDIVFTAVKTDEPLLAQLPVFSEPMVLIAGGDTRFAEPVAVQQLPTQNEVYVEWTGHFARWHQKLFENRKPQIRISMMAHLRRFMEKENCWAIVPASVAEGLSKEIPIRILQTDIPLPRREIRCLLTATKERNETMQAFLDCLYGFVAKDPQLTAMEK